MALIKVSGILPERLSILCCIEFSLVMRLLLLSPPATAGEMFPTPLRIAVPHPPTNGTVPLVVSNNDTSVLTSNRIAGIDVLTTTNLNDALSRWRELAGERILTNGQLRMDYPGTQAESQRYFAAREAVSETITVHDPAELRAAVATAKAGTFIRMQPGQYSGGFFFATVQGAANRPIVIAAADPNNPPVIQGGGNGMQFSDAAFVELHDLVFAGATGNGLNMDDGGSFDTPAHHLVLRRLRITDVGPTGNHDGIKLSGVVDFRVEDCIIERWGAGGSAIDMVGCHSGIIESNMIRHNPVPTAQGASGVQTKGGSRDVVIRRNRFEHAGARAINIGGSTGLEYFRPPLQPGQAHWEAKDILVEGNTFIGAQAPIAFVGVDAATVRFNTIYRPERWAMRILQETTEAGFVPCRLGRFTDNIIAFYSSQWASGGINVGPNTAPETFQFARNWWFCVDDPARSYPSLPMAETGGVYGQSPQFRDAEGGDLGLQPGSPAHAVGASALGN